MPPSCTQVGSLAVRPVPLALYVYISAVIFKPDFWALSILVIDGINFIPVPGVIDFQMINLSGNISFPGNAKSFIQRFVNLSLSLRM